MDDRPFNSTDHQRPLHGRGSGGVTRRGFQPGVSGCPGGRPRQDVTELARAHTVDAIEALVAALKRPKEAVPAAIALLNRGWGLPKLPVETGGDSFGLMHLIAARTIGEQLQHARDAQKANGVDYNGTEPPVIDWTQPALE
jgi:hypothetical protein